MKQKSLWMLTMLLACCISLVFSSCTDDDGVEPTPPSPEGPTLDPSVEPIDPVQCTAAVEFGDISSLPEELQTALKNRFPNMTANGDADICFCKASDVEKFSAQLLKGTTTIVAMPGNGGAMDNIINLAGGVVPKNTAPILFYATQKWGQHYVMLDGGIPYDLNTTEEKVEFYERRIIPLVYWLNEVETFKKNRKLREEAAQNNQPYNYDELVANIEDEGLYMKYNFPMSLDNSYILEGNKYDLKAASSVDYGLRVYPLYKQSCHEEKSGDYYVVTAEITPYNQNMWKPYSQQVGIFGDTMHLKGYWFHKMSTHIKLVDMDGNDIPGIDYNLMPLPENEVDSRQYSEGTSNTVGGSASAGFASGAPTGSLGLSFSHTVNSTVSYCMDIITYTLDSSSPNREVSYVYDSKGVTPTDDEDDDKYFPKNCRTQWTVRQAWVWFVPRGQAGVDDNKDTKFQILLNSRIDYQFYWWVWHPIIPNESGDTYTYTPCIVENYAWELQPPHRDSWGLISIKSEYTDAVMTTIRYYITGEEEKDPVAVDDMSYHQSDYAFMGLSDKYTYTIIYETKDPNTGEHMDSWKFENVEVHQGKTKDDATTSLSTVNATKIDKK